MWRVKNDETRERKSSLRYTRDTVLTGLPYIMYDTAYLKHQCLLLFLFWNCGTLDTSTYLEVEISGCVVFLDTASYFATMEDRMRRPSSDVPPASDVNANLAVASKKQPPPESLESIRIRSLVVASFWAIVVFLGLPTWWWTTSIHRARLPLREMLEWADGKVCVFLWKSCHRRLV